MMADARHNVIRDGAEDRERARIVARLMHPASMALLDRLGFIEGLECADIGCGTGDVTLELARRIGPTGKTVGFDIDLGALDVARAEAENARVASVEFSYADIREATDQTYDVVYSRCLLSQLADPVGAVQAFRARLRPGGVLAVEDFDLSGSFTYPDSPAFRRFLELSVAIATRRGSDPNIGARLPVLLAGAGFVDVEMTVVQPAGIVGDVKSIAALMMENLAPAVLADGLATQDDIDGVIRDLHELAASPHTVAGMPRVVQVWGRRPSDHAA